MARSKFHVTKTDKGWQGKQEGASKASTVKSTKKEAVSRTIEIAKGKGNSSVYIHKQDGKI